MQYNINGHGRIGHADGAQHIFGIVDVDIADHGKAEQPHGFLAMDHHDYSRASHVLEPPYSAPASCFEHVLLYNRLKRRRHEEYPQ